MRQGRRSRKDPIRIVYEKKSLHIAERLDKNVIYTLWTRDDKKRRRKLPDIPGGRRLPVLALSNATLRRSVRKWYCGSFPITSSSKIARNRGL